MPGQFSFEAQILRLSFRGETSLEALAELLDRALADPKCPPRPLVLSDLRGSTSIKRRPSDEMKTAVALFSERGAKLADRFAVVALGGVQYGVMRTASAYSEHEGMEVRIFEDDDAAKDWLLTP